MKQTLTKLRGEKNINYQGQLHNHSCRVFFFFFFKFIFISWRLITSQHFSGFCHTLTWISHGVTCIPHLDPPSHLPLHPIPLGLLSAPGPSSCLMHPTWAGDLRNWLFRLFVFDQCGIGFASIYFLGFLFFLIPLFYAVSVTYFIKLSALSDI